MYQKIPSKPTADFHRRQRAKEVHKSLRGLALVNSQGDSYRQNKQGQVTDLMYSQQQRSYSFEYNESGELTCVASSDGWSWTRLQDCWVVRNYFDGWTVSFEDCQNVVVSPEGIQAVGKDPSQMGLPQRP